MAPHTIPLSVALLTLVMTPIAAASWSAFGATEPDTAFDDASFMFFDPPGQALDPIYFAAWQEEAGLANPNTGLLGGSRMGDMGAYVLHALLGEWVDCNGDGYVGLADHAWTEYPDVLLAASDIARCPPGSAHNSGGWVTELLWIGPQIDNGFGTPMDHDARIIGDDGAKVWGDEGLPESSRFAPCTELDTSDSSTMLASADCADSFAMSPREPQHETYDFYASGGAPRFGRKTLEDWAFSFTGEARQNLPTPGIVLAHDSFSEVGVGPARVPLLSLIPAQQPQCLGLSAAEPACARTAWTATATTVRAREDFARVSLARAMVSTVDRAFMTFYATVSDGVGTLPGGSGVYGAPVCAQIGAGVQPERGWDCDPTHWPADLEGMPRLDSRMHALVGERYVLRDVACDDGQIVDGVPVHAGPGQLGRRCDEA